MLEEPPKVVPCEEADRGNYRESKHRVSDLSQGIQRYCVRRNVHWSALSTPLLKCSIHAVVDSISLRHYYSLSDYPGSRWATSLKKSGVSAPWHRSDCAFSSNRALREKGAAFLMNWTNSAPSRSWFSTWRIWAIRWFCDRKRVCLECLYTTE